MLKGLRLETVGFSWSGDRLFWVPWVLRHIWKSGAEPFRRWETTFPAYFMLSDSLELCMELYPRVLKVGTQISLAATVFNLVWELNFLWALCLSDALGSPFIHPKIFFIAYSQAQFQSWWPKGAQRRQTFFFIELIPHQQQIQNQNKPGRGGTPWIPALERQKEENFCEF